MEDTALGRNVPASWSAALALSLTDGLDALLAAVQQAEASDPNRERWRRPKTHDDKAAVLILFPAHPASGEAS
jgi:hypothetical protein